MDASCAEKIVEAVTDILRRTPHLEMKRAFDHWVHHCDWAIIRSDEYYQE
jgi:hypothetical protein